MRNIVVYTTSGCGKCLLLKRDLDNKNITYDVETDMDKIIKKANELGVIDMPILDIDGIFYSGSDALLQGKGI